MFRKIMTFLRRLNLNIRLLIKCKNLDMLQAFSDEVYLYEYIVNNYSELPEENIFRNPTFLKS